MKEDTKRALRHFVSVGAAAASLLATTGSAPSAWVDSALKAARTRTATVLTSAQPNPGQAYLLPAATDTAVAMSTAHRSHASHKSHASHYSHRSHRSGL